MNKFDSKLKFHEKQILSEMAYGFSNASKGVTQAELVEKIKSLTDSDLPVKMTSITDATYVKSPKRNTLGTVYKVSQISGLLNSNYAARKQQKLDVTVPGTQYQAGKSYGTHLSGSIVEQNGKHYVQVLPENTESPRFVVKNNTGQFKEEDNSVVASIMAPAKAFGTAPADEVIIRRYGIGSIVAIEIAGESYVVSDVDPERKAVLDIVNSTKSL